MKQVKIFSYFLLLAFCLTSIQQLYGGNDTPETIELKKIETSGGPRTPIPYGSPIISAYLLNDALILHIENYTGNIQVEIIGINGFASNFTVSGSGSSYIDISTLTVGIYTLRIITNTSIYTGQFIL